MKTLFLGLLFGVLFVLTGCAKAEPHCDDFLAKISKKPEFVELLSCTQDNNIQGKPFIARYRIKGTDALEAERYMNQSFGLPKLQHICCGWDSAPFFYRDEKTHLGYMLGMGSEETPVDKRDSWSEIKYFYINVSFFTEDT